MPHLPTQRVRRDDDSVAEAPLVLARATGASQVVECVCPRAEALGIRVGLTVGQACAIAPQLQVRPHGPQRDRAVLRRLARWVWRFSPQVEPVEPQALLVDITGCQRLFGGEEALARQAVTGLARLGFHARAAVADTVGAAWALAVAGPEPLCVLPPGETTAGLAPLPPYALRIDPRVAERLDAVGVRTLGDLFMLPRSSLPARFGSELVRRLQQALGEVPETIASFIPAQTPAAARRFESPVSDAATIRHVACELLADVFAQVLAQDHALRRLECVLCYEDVPPRVLSVGLAQASRRREHVQRLLLQRLEAVDLGMGVTALRLLARHTTRYRGGQGELFEPRTPGDDEELASLIDRIANRLGYEQVLRPQLVDDHQPEMACRYVSVAQVGLETGKSASSPASGEKMPSPAEFGLPTIDAPSAGAAASTLPGQPVRPPRPTQLLDRPMPIRVIALVPDGPPTWLSWRGRDYVILHAAGPERLETAWWRGADLRRDYFRVTAESGEQFWIFHDAVQRRWYLHGVFA